MLHKVKSMQIFFAGGFKGKCNNCGKIGHKAQDCRNKNGRNEEEKKARTNEDDKNIECFYCKR